MLTVTLTRLTRLLSMMLSVLVLLTALVLNTKLLVLFTLVSTILHLCSSETPTDELDYSFTFLSAFDPEGLATIDYVDNQEIESQVNLVVIDWSFETLLQ